ncbi:homoserine dehydrogenase [Rubrimonas cliftonensis]|uniref:Homoserine dehydrogenase n=1 Tax=Rubrimonas cliftonensis TaxID=89524 RepID=A0A1H4FR26_9RHOB|nr:homoserine dehydrogenase [Rubrimonas cliftonensis]SEA99809.1 homoserine dehydrogenase [Rubrimonas cliftonensis]
MRTVKVAVAGFGGVGRATATLLLSRRERYRRVHGADVRIVAACGSSAGVADPAGLEAERFDALKDGLTGPDFVAASGADILIEAGPTDFRTGGPGLAYIRSALSAGRDAVVISKGALIHSGRELRESAQVSGAMLKISGAAAAALPTIDLLDNSLTGCKVLGVDGVLNATTNHLLDAMTTRGLGFEQALREAQAGGFAEADPRNDVEGWDTACKLLLIANFGLGADLTMHDLAVEGIQSVTAGDVAAWRAAGLVPKLVGTIAFEGGVIRASVGVRTYPPTDPFAQVRGKAKAIRIMTDGMGETVAISNGAEPLATAAAALKDLEHILVARAKGRSS